MFSESALWENNTRYKIFSKNKTIVSTFWNNFFFKLKFLTEQWNPHSVFVSKFLQHNFFHWPIRNLALFQTQNIFKTIFLQKHFDDILNCSIHLVPIVNTVNSFKIKHQSWLVTCHWLPASDLSLFVFAYASISLVVPKSTIMMYMFTQNFQPIRIE